MNEQREQSERLIDAYLDGEMSDADRRAFEAQVQRDEHLRALLDQQRRIDALIRRRFASPERWQVDRERLAGQVDGAAGANEGAESPSAKPGRGMLFPGSARARMLAAAAAVVITFIGAWLTYTGFQHWQAGTPDLMYLPTTQRTMDETYRHIQALNFRPDWVCETDEEFIEAFDARFQQPLRISDLPEEIAALGLSYCYTLSPWTLCVLVKVEDDSVLVFVDRLEADQPIELDEAHGLHLFRREVGELVLYELTPRDQPAVLRHFTPPN